MKWIFLLVLIVAIAGCTQTETSPNQDIPTDNQNIPTDQDSPVVENAEQKDSSTKLDECGNDLGNGNETVPGPPGPSENMEDRDNPFHSLTVHPTNPDIVYLGTERNGFLKSVDGGISWMWLRNGLRHSPEGYPEIYDIGIAGSDPNILYAATVGSPGPLSGEHAGDSGVYTSRDGGETWTRKNCGITNARVTSIQVSSEDPNRAVTSPSGGYPSFTGELQNQYFEGGLLLTTDGGETWTRTSDFPFHEKSAYSVIIAARDNPLLLYSFGFDYEGEKGESAGFVKSLDGGEIWTTFAPEMRSSEVRTFAISADGSVLYAITDMDMYKSLDGGETWTVHELWSSGYSVAVFPSDPDKVIFSKYDGIYLSTDGMETDTKVLSHDTGLYDIVIAPSDESIVYAVGLEYVVYKSTDGGLTFTKLGNLRNDVLNSPS